MASPLPEPLIFPAGVRFPRDDEFPLGYEAERTRIAQARITTGFIAKHHSSTAFTAYFEANVHAPRLWSLVRDLARAILPAAAAPIVGVKGDEPVLGAYTTREAAIGVFEPFVETLQHDGFLEFGVIFQRNGVTEEVFVKSVTYVQVWTNHPAVARRVFREHRLPETPDLQFIDDYPRVTESLRDGDGNAGWPAVLEALSSAFESLPDPPTLD